MSIVFLITSQDEFLKALNEALNIDTGLEPAILDNTTQHVANDNETVVDPDIKIIQGQFDLVHNTQKQNQNQNPLIFALKPK